MPRWCIVDPYDYERWIETKRDGYIQWRGLEEFLHREIAKEVARRLRFEGVRARMFIVPKAYTDGGHFGGHPEKFVVFIPDKLTQDEYGVLSDAMHWIRNLSKKDERQWQP